MTRPQCYPDGIKFMLVIQMSSQKKSREEAAGMGGWLAFLVFRNMILVPGFGIGRVSSGLSEMAATYPDLLHLEQWSRYKSGMWFITLAASLIYVVAGYRLWKGTTWDVVSFAIKVEWAGFIGSSLGAAWIINYAFGASVFSDPSFVGSAIASMFIAAFWTAYLLKSVRVRNTYH